MHLIDNGKAFVCSLTDEEIRKYRGTVKEAGRPSPDRDRPAAESLDLFARMKDGEFEEGQYTLRAKIDMGHANMKIMCGTKDFLSETKISNSFSMSSLPIK